MVAVDTSSLVAFFSGSEGTDTELIAQALQNRNLVLPPVVLAEILSAPNLSKKLESLILRLPLLPLNAGVWERCGVLRRALIARGRKARLADSLIAQLCIDAGSPFLTRDRDFEKYQEFGLQLV